MSAEKLNSVPEIDMPLPSDFDTLKQIQIQTLPSEGERIFDLTDVVEETAGERPVKLNTVSIAVEEKPVAARPAPVTVNPVLEDPIIREEIFKQVRHAAERIVRELVPDIAERVIRDEIKKLKDSENI